MIYKIKIKDKRTGEESFIIMGDSYKSFKEHLINIVGNWTEKWHYESEDKHAKCFGRTLAVEFLEIWFSKNRFVSFGGLKMASEKIYDKEVEKHNQSDNYEPCKYLKDINWKLKNKAFVNLLMKENRVISEEELQRVSNKKWLCQ